MAEKAPNEFVLYKDGAGGHASKPGRGTVLGDVARAMAAVEAHPMPYRLTPLVKAHLKAVAPLQDKERRDVASHPKKNWKQLVKLAKKDRITDALLHTTFAVTMAEGSSQANVLPSHAEATLSVRILQGDTVESVKDYLESIMPDGVKVKASYAENPHPAGSVDSPFFTLLSDTIHDVYGKDTVVAPNLMLGATDSRNYSEVCDNIFRFTGRVRTPAWGEAHQVDERMPIDRLDRPVKFIKAFLENYRNQ
jgi:carboxypeptidase PM20D1